MKRRDFLKLTGAAVAVAATSGLNPLLAQTAPKPEVVWVEGGEPAALFAKGMEALGGMSNFVTKGDVVLVKPNIGWDRTPEFAANTNPELVEAVVKACFEAGAKEVKLFDNTCNNAQRCYINSGIRDKAEAAGAKVYHVQEERFKPIKLTKGEILKEWPIYQDYLEVNKVINVPIAKHHGLATVTLGLKNLMGVMGGNRGELHSPFRKLIDVVADILPTLTIIDAYRTLLNHGPRGGDLADVKLTKTLIASSCTVSADVTALELFGHKLKDIPHIQDAVDRGLAKFDVKNLKPLKLTVS